MIALRSFFRFAFLFLSLIALVCGDVRISVAQPPTPGKSKEARNRNGHQNGNDQNAKNGIDKDENGEKEDGDDDKKEDDKEEDDKDDPIETDRPDFTEASSVVPAGRVQFEMGYTFFQDDSQGVRLRTHSAPEILCRIGLLEGLEFRIVWNYLTEREDDFGDVSRISGAEDLELGVKVALAEQRDWFPETAMILQFTVPTGRREFSNNDVTYTMSLLYGWDLPCDFSLGGSTIYANPAAHTFVGAPPLAIAETFDHHNQFAQSVTLGIPLVGDWWRMYIEYFGLFSEGREVNTPENYIDGGFTWLLNDDLQLDWRAGFGLNDSAEDFFTGAGVSWRY